MKTYYKLATYRAHLLTFQDGKKAYPTEAAAIKDAKRAGRYRVSTVSDTGRMDGEPFDVARTPAHANVSMNRPQYPAHATRPMGGRPH